MYNFRGLVGMEYRKLFRKKIVWVTVVLLAAVCLVSGLSGLFGRYYVNGEPTDTHANMLRTDSAYARSLSGHPIDDRLLREMQEAYRKVPENTEIPYSATEEYQKYARPYSEIHNFVLRVAGNSWDTISQADLYQLRLAAVEQGWKQLLLTDAEKGYLEKQEDSLEVPFVYGYDDGYTNYMSLLFTTGLLLLLGIAVCVPQIFSEEYSRKTDQLIASSPLGKTPLYLAKIFTGLTFCLGLALFLAGITAAAVFAVYGTDGFETAIQLDYPGLSWNITVGEAALILTGIYLLSALLLGSAAMLLSQLFRSSTPAMAVFLGYLLMVAVFNIPEEYRIPAQLWSYFPTVSTNLSNAFSQRLLAVGDVFLTGWQVVSLLYPAATAALLLVNYRKYRKMPG